MHEELSVVSSELKDAKLNKNDLSVVMTAVKYELIYKLNDIRREQSGGIYDGIMYTLRMQNRIDLVKLIECEVLMHSPFEIK